MGGDNGDRLTNLRFADDLILVASSREQLTAMVQNLMDAVQKVGLELHPGKTKVLTNQTWRRGESLQLRSSDIEIVDSVEYLGRLLTFTSLHEAEVEHRIGKAWKKFASMKRELCSKHYPLRQRLRLFDASVSATMLYGSGTWTMTAAFERRIRVTQRRMIRWMVGVGRQRSHGAPTCKTDAEAVSEDGSSSNSSMTEPSDNEEADMEETYVEWIKRATGISETHLKKAGLEDWVSQQRRRKFRLAGHIVRRTDGRWSTRMVDWEPNGYRTVGRPRRRWEDCLTNHFHEDDQDGAFLWRVAAHSREYWRSQEADFVTGR
jgi:hypothetical protein